MAFKSSRRKFFAASSYSIRSGVGDTVIIDLDDLSGNKRFTVISITSNIDTLEKLVGHHGSEQTKPLFEIVEALNHEILELKFKIEEIKSKEKNYEPD